MLSLPAVPDPKPDEPEKAIENSFDAILTVGASDYLVRGFDPNITNLVLLIGTEGKVVKVIDFDPDTQEILDFETFREGDMNRETVDRLKYTNAPGKLVYNDGKKQFHIAEIIQTIDEAKKAPSLVELSLRAPRISVEELVSSVEAATL